MLPSFQKVERQNHPSPLIGGFSRPSRTVYHSILGLSMSFSLSMPKKVAPHPEKARFDFQPAIFTQNIVHLPSAKRTKHTFPFHRSHPPSNCCMAPSKVVSLDRDHPPPCSASEIVRASQPCRPVAGKQPRGHGGVGVSIGDPSGSRPNSLAGSAMDNRVRCDDGVSVMIGSISSATGVGVGTGVTVGPGVGLGSCGVGATIRGTSGGRPDSSGTKVQGPEEITTTKRRFSRSQSECVA